MKQNFKVIFCLIFSIFLISSLSGCIFDDLFSDKSSTDFSLYKDYIIDDDGFPSIYLNFTCSDRVTTNLLDYNNVIIDSDYFIYGTVETALHLSSYGEIVNPGAYYLEVYDEDDERIYQRSYSVVGSDLSILSCDQKWWKSELSSDDYKLVGLSMIVKNNGDVPAYPFSIDLTIDSLIYPGTVIPIVILPGQIKQVDCVINKKGAPDNNNFNVKLKDRYDNVLCSDSFTANVIDNTFTKKYSWRYDKVKREIDIPDLDYLFDYYDGLDRIQNNDYSLYIYDPYDEPYIEILVESLMFNFNNDNDIERINYVASFVQNMEYRTDSLTDDSYEYPRYPVETLFNGVKGCGDCEDKAILTAALLDNLGYDIGLIRLPEHMAVGVILDEDQLPNYEYYIDSYFFLETTTAGKPLGYIPNEYKSSTEIDVFPIITKPLLIHHWKGGSITIYTNSELGDFVKVDILVENLGRLTASSIEVECGFFTDDGLRLNGRSDFIYNLAPNTKKEITFKADIPKGYTTLFKTRIHLYGEMVDERESSSYFPT